MPPPPPPQEDEQLRQLVEKHGTKAWAKIASVMRTKGSKQCRRRWKNSLNMSAKTCSWSAEVGLHHVRLQAVATAACR